MKKEDLVKLKEKLSSFSEEDLKERDLYLKGLATGEIQGPPVGYQSIDKPWLKYYDLENNISSEIKTAYQCMYDNNKEHENDLAIEYFGAKINFGKLFKNIESAAKSFEACGVKKGDFVTICAPGIPETVYSFYALSKLGAASNMIGNHFDKQDFIDRIADCNCKILIVMDEFYDGIKEAVKNSNIEKVVVVPTLNSSPLGLISKKYKIASSNNEVYWNQFMNEGKILEKSETVPYEPDMPLTMVYSSGTTGASKGILLSNDSFQKSIAAYFKSGLDISRGQKFYQMIPTWASTGISTSIHLPLSCGASVYMDPRFERKVFVKNVLKVKPNYTVSTTSMYEGLIDDPKLKDKDFSFFTNAFEGGEPLTADMANRINGILKDYGIKAGYGQCECGATITTQTNNTENANGSVGIPLPGINIQICNNDFEELTTGERGQIVVDTPCSMLEYYKNEQANDEFFYIDPNGKKWNCTGDIGYMDEKGNLFVEGRASDYSIIDGEQIYNFDIEKIVKKIQGIKLCEVLPKKDENGNDNLAVHLIMESEFNQGNTEKLFRDIQNEIYQTSESIKMVPSLFKIRKEFPSNIKSGKRDVLAMKNEKDGFTFVQPEIEKESHRTL